MAGTGVNGNPRNQTNIPTVHVEIRMLMQTVKRWIPTAGTQSECTKRKKTKKRLKKMRKKLKIWVDYL